MPEKPESIRCPTCDDDDVEVLTTVGLAERVLCLGCQTTFSVEILRDNTEKGFEKPQIAIYRRFGRWYYFLQIDGEFDQWGKLGIDDAANERTARAAAHQLFSHLGEFTVWRMPDHP